MPNVVPLRLSNDRALHIIRAAAASTGKVVWTDHVLKRMEKRRITPMQVLTCLRLGHITEAPYWDPVHGTWPVTMERLAAGEKITVGLAIDLKHDVVIITVF